MIEKVAWATVAVADQDVMRDTEAWGSFVRVTDPEGRQLMVRSAR